MLPYDIYSKITSSPLFKSVLPMSKSLSSESKDVKSIELTFEFLSDKDIKDYIIGTKLDSLELVSVKVLTDQFFVRGFDLSDYGFFRRSPEELIKFFISDFDIIDFKKSDFFFEFAMSSKKAKLASPEGWDCLGGRHIYFTLSRAIPFIKNTKIALDIGSGIGESATALNNIFSSVTCIESDQTLLPYLTTNIAKQNAVIVSDKVDLIELVEKSVVYDVVNQTLDSAPEVVVPIKKKTSKKKKVAVETSEQDADAVEVPTFEEQMPAPIPEPILIPREVLTVKARAISDFANADVGLIYCAKGFEFLLEGLKQSLTETRPVIILSRKCTNHDVFSLLRGAGYTISFRSSEHIVLS